MAQPVSQRSLDVFETIANFYRFVSGPAWDKMTGGGDYSDFVFGNPHEMPLSAFTAGLQRWITPQNQMWHAYKNSERSSQEIVAATLRQIRGLPFAEEDICMTNGAFAALAVTITAVVDPGDEVIFISPPWFFYEAMIVASGA